MLIETSQLPLQQRIPSLRLRLRYVVPLVILWLIVGAVYLGS